MLPVVFVLNGPNLNRLGRREPAIYGRQTLDEIREECLVAAARLELTVDFRQSNHEGDLVTWLHESDDAAAAVVLNAAGYTRTSLAILDAIKSIDTPVIELHLSNLAKRESYRPPSLVSHGAVGMICGFGGFGYVLALQAARHLIDRKPAASSAT